MIGVSKDKYCSVHKLRFEQSVEFLKPYVDVSSNILEMGQPGFFTEIFRENFKFSGLHNTWQDLRNPVNYGDAVFDLVLCMELIEHLKDKEEGNKSYNETFYGTSQSNLIKECYRILKTNGVLFLTTPNVNSIRSLKNLLNFNHPYGYWNHVREVSVEDLKKYLSEAGFSIEILETKESWYEMSMTDKKMLKGLEKFGFSPKMRGDNIFVIARKI